MTREEAYAVLSMVEAHGIADKAKQIAMKALEQEPCTDAISRQAVFKQLKGCLTGGESEYNYVKLHIDSIPPVAPQPKTGCWIIKSETSAVCSSCHKHNLFYGDFCKWCGARMDKPEEQDELLDKIIAEIYENYMSIDGKLYDKTALKCIKIIKKYKVRKKVIK